MSLLTRGSVSGSGTEVDEGYDLLTNVCWPMSEEAKWDQVLAKTCQSNCAKLLVYSTTTRQIVVKRIHMHQMDAIFLIKKRERESKAPSVSSVRIKNPLCYLSLFWKSLTKDTNGKKKIHQV